MIFLYKYLVTYSPRVLNDVLATSLKAVKHLWWLILRTMDDTDESWLIKRRNQCGGNVGRQHSAELCCECAMHGIENFLYRGWIYLLKRPRDSLCIVVGSEAPAIYELSLRFNHRLTRLSLYSDRRTEGLFLLFLLRAGGLVHLSPCRRPVEVCRLWRVVLFISFCCKRRTTSISSCCYSCSCYRAWVDISVGEMAEEGWVVGCFLVTFDIVGVEVWWLWWRERGDNSPSSPGLSR